MWPPLSSFPLPLPLSFGGFLSSVFGGLPRPLPPFESPEPPFAPELPELPAPPVIFPPVVPPAVVGVFGVFPPAVVVLGTPLPPEPAAVPPPAVPADPAEGGRSLCVAPVPPVLFPPLPANELPLAPFAPTTPEPVNAPGFAVPATPGLPWFTDANCALFVLATCSCFTGPFGGPMW